MASNSQKTARVSIPGWRTRRGSVRLYIHRLWSPMSLHQFLDLALILTHDGLKVSRFQDDTTSDQDDVVAAGQERNAVRDKDPCFGRE